MTKRHARQQATAEMRRILAAMNAARARLSPQLQDDGALALMDDNQIRRRRDRLRSIEEILTIESALLDSVLRKISVLRTLSAVDAGSPPPAAAPRKEETPAPPAPTARGGGCRSRPS